MDINFQHVYVCLLYEDTSILTGLM